MKLSEKLFLWFSAIVSILLMAVLVLFALQKHGILDLSAGKALEDTQNKTQENLLQEETITEKIYIREPGIEEIQTEGWKELQPPPVIIDVSNMEIETEAEEADPYPYYIKVNKKQNCVTIYQKDKAGEYTKPVKAMVCSTGYATPTGIYGSKGKYAMKGLIHGVFGQYSTWITGNILFHSVPSAKPTKDSVIVRNYNQLGTTASAGCIRLTVADAKWIYDNCEIGTLIEIYNGEEIGPLGKPEAIKLPDGSKWDPTDPDPENPWHKHSPVILVEKEKILFFGEEWEPYKDIVALDTCGNDITEKVEISGKVDCYTPGRYPVTFTVTDAVGKTASADCEYLVIPVPAQQEVEE